MVWSNGKNSLDKTFANGTINPKAEIESELVWDPTNTADKSVSWSSDNQGVATVSGDSLKVVGIGTAKITLTSRANPELSVVLNVTVPSEPAEQGA